MQCVPKMYQTLIKKSIKNRVLFLDNNNRKKLKKILKNNGKINLKKRRLQQMV